jgi:threonine synthase
VAQERQIATLGGNVRAFAVAGAFDDCQRLVKAAFADARLARAHRLVAANSIHPARLLAQIVYYFDAVAELRRRDPRAATPTLVVPSGNFGNLAAGVIARRLGAPIGRLVLATNENRTVPEHLDGAAYRPRPSVATLSNAMDVGAPNNWERVLWLHGGEVERVRAELDWGSADDEETLAELARLARLGYRADPHGAVASRVLRERVPAEVPAIFLATAHPAKFDATAAGAPLPETLALALERPLRSEPLAADEEALALALADGWPESREELP